MVARRKLASTVESNGIRYFWHNVNGLTFVAVDSEIPMSANRVASLLSPEGHKPGLIILGNEVESFYRIMTNRMTMDRDHALNLLNDLMKKLNHCDRTQGNWVVDEERNMVRSPNHGSVTSLSLAEIVNVVKIYKNLSKHWRKERCVTEM